MVTSQDRKESMLWFTGDQVQGFSASATRRSKGRPTPPRSQASPSEVNKCHSDCKKLHKSLRKKEKQRRKLQMNFGIGIGVV